MSIDVAAVLGAVHGPWVYAVVLVGAVLESAAFVGLVVPGETILLLAGATAALGGVDLLGVLACGVLGAVLGDQVGYSIGHACGEGLRRGRLGRRIGPGRWAQAESLVMRRGGPAVFLARWIGVLRALVPAVAGAAGMSRRTFTVWNAVGGTLWAGSVVGAGFAAGASWPLVVGRLGLGAGILVGLAVLLVLAVVLRQVLRRRCSRRRSEPHSWSPHRPARSVVAMTTTPVPVGDDACPELSSPPPDRPRTAPPVSSPAGRSRPWPGPRVSAPPGWSAVAPPVSGR